MACSALGGLSVTGCAAGGCVDTPTGTGAEGAGTGWEAAEAGEAGAPVETVVAAGSGVPCAAEKEVKAEITNRNNMRFFILNHIKNLIMTVNGFCASARRQKTKVG